MTEKIVGAIKISYTGSIIFWPTCRVADRPHGPNGFLGDEARAAFSGMTLPRTGQRGESEYTEPNRIALHKPTFTGLIRTMPNWTSESPTTRSEYAGRERHFSIQLVLPRTVRRRCLGCQECQSKSKTGHASSAPACDLYAFLVTVQ